MKNVLSNGLMIAGMLSAPVAVTNAGLPSPAASPIPAPEQHRTDPRLEVLKGFFRKGNCPARDFSEEFLKAADRHNLDWRLLPSISLVESGCGREARNNNLFGWDGGRAIFASVEAGIHDVAYHLAHSKLYRDKSLDEVLRMYNPVGDYPGVVKSVMKRISPTEKL